MTKLIYLKTNNISENLFLNNNPKKLFQILKEFVIMKIKNLYIEESILGDTSAKKLNKNLNLKTKLSVKIIKKFLIRKPKF